MENHHSLNDRQILKSTLAWTSIILSGIAIAFLLISLISGMIFNSYEMSVDLPDDMIFNTQEYKISGLMIFAYIFAILFFTGLIWSSFGFLKMKKWAEELMSVYMWVFTVIIPLAYLLYWVAEKKELVKMKESLIKNPEITQFYETGNLALNTQLILLGVAVLFAMVLLIKVNMKMKN